MEFSEFAKKFGTEKQCLKYLYKLRWRDGFRCPRCNHDKKWDVKEFKYKCRGCSYQTTVIAGTRLHGTRIPIKLWFLAIWHITSNEKEISALELQKILGLGSNRTALRMWHELKRIMEVIKNARLKKPVKIEKLRGKVTVCEKIIRIHRGYAYDDSPMVYIAIDKNGRICMSSDRDNDFNSFIENNMEADIEIERGTSFPEQIENKFQSWLQGKLFPRDSLPRKYSKKHLDEYLYEFCTDYNKNLYKATLGEFLYYISRPVAHRQQKKSRSSP